MSDFSPAVFLLHDAELRQLPARPFRAGVYGETLEAALQALIARHPEVIPGAEIDPEADDPPRFALLRKEMPIAGWSLDLLLVDQRGVLTLVETKLAENPEARREVVGQLLEYAANARERWGRGGARQLAEDYWKEQGRSVDEVLGKHLGDGGDLRAFWNQVEDTLHEGRFRLIIVADRLRPEVRRIIEFLNDEMETVEVYGLELQCYGGETQGLVLVPRLVGQTQASVDRKRTGHTGEVAWTPERLREGLGALEHQVRSARLNEALTWALEHGCFMEARGKHPVFGLQGRTGWRMFTLQASGSLYWFVNERIYRSVAERDQLQSVLQAQGLLAEHFDPAEVAAGRTLSKRLEDFASEELQAFLASIAPFCAAKS